jgi:cytochrome c oxidase assembly factor CtaG
MSRPAAIAAALLLTCPPAAWAHGKRAEPGAWYSAWSWDPLLLLSLGLLAGLYGRGLARLWGKAGVGRKVGWWQAVAYLGALVVLFVALLSPLDALSEELSSAHMAQHMLLMTVAAPLFILGAPTLVLAWGLLPMGNGEWGMRNAFHFAFRIPHSAFLWQPLFLWALYAVTLWAWHHPTLYQAALRQPLVHDAQHLSFFVAACLFWRGGLDPLGRRRLHPAAAVPYLFLTSLHASALGVFLALSPRPWYSDYMGRTPAWGLTPLEDQQLAGLIMWMPACLIYPAVAATLFGSWLAGLAGTRREGERAERCQPAAGG